MSALHYNTGLIIKDLAKLVIDLRLSVFLVLCFVLGGTSQDIVEPKFPLYLISVVLIAWALMKLNRSSRIWKLKVPLALFLVFIALNLLYLIPLPPSIWTGLPGRDFIQNGYEVMGMELPWLPLSLTPEASLFSMLDFLPPTALFLSVGTLASKREIRWGIYIILPFAILTMFLGFAQISSDHSLFHYYKFTNGNLAVGFFSNVNHQASFLLMAIPFSIGLAHYLSQGRHVYSFGTRTAIIMGYVLAIVLLIGVFLIGSVAGYVLAVPVILASLLLFLPKMNIRKHILAGTALLAIAVIVMDFLYFGNHLAEFFDEFTSNSPTSRHVLFAKTIEIGRAHFPIGTGPGSFSSVYKIHETFTTNTIPHTHNDFLETFQELGLFGLVWISAFLMWWLRTGFKNIARRGRSNVIANCAFIATFSVILHSLVDYPLRTISIMTLFVFCICMMALPKNEIL